jgi:hypothetical protein
VNGPGGPDLDGAEAIRLFELRTDPMRALAGQADAVAAACHAMAVRFHRGGKLVVFGTGGSSTDAQHVAVEFVHPVIVGKRALPAIALTTDVATVTGIAERDGVAAIFAHQIRFLADPADIALGISADGHSTSGRARGGRRPGAADDRPGRRGRRADRDQRRGRSPAAGPLARSPGGQGDARDHLPRAVGAGARVLRAARRARPGGDRVTAEPRGGPSPAGVPECYGDVCITCSDTAVEVTVLRLLEDELAVVDTGLGEETVSVALVTARVGDTILVHAREAIAVVGR